MRRGAASPEDQESLARTLEELAARVRAESVVDYSVEFERGVVDVPVGPNVEHVPDGRTRIVVTVELWVAGLSLSETSQVQQGLTDDRAEPMG